MTATSCEAVSMTVMSHVRLRQPRCHQLRASHCSDVPACNCTQMLHVQLYKRFLHMPWLEAEPLTEWGEKNKAPNLVKFAILTCQLESIKVLTRSFFSHILANVWHWGCTALSCGWMGTRVRRETQVLVLGWLPMWAWSLEKALEKRSHGGQLASRWMIVAGLIQSLA